MKLDGADYANYQLILQTVDGREILRRRTGKVRFGKDPAFVRLPVKAGELTRGDYILILFGQTADGRSKEIEPILLPGVVKKISLPKKTATYFCSFSE